MKKKKTHLEKSVKLILFLKTEQSLEETVLKVSRIDFRTAFLDISEKSNPIP